MGFVVTDICRDLQNGCGELTRLKLGNDDQEEDDAILLSVISPGNLPRSRAEIRRNSTIRITARYGTEQIRNSRKLWNSLHP